MPTGIYKRKPISEETRLKHRLANLGSKNPMYGKKSSQLQKETVSKMMKGNKHRVNKIPHNKGKFGYKVGPASEERKLKISKSNKGKIKLNMIGEKHWNWIKDRTKLAKHQIRNDYMYIDWRKNVCNRDHWKCKINNEHCNGVLEVHHIFNYKEYPELRYIINNGITLCHAHHPRKRAEEKRLISYFQELVSVSNI